MNGYIEKKGLSKCLVFDSTDENKELLKKHSDVFNGIMSKIRDTKDFMKLNLVQMMTYH